MHRRNLVASTVLALSAALTLTATSADAADAAPASQARAGSYTVTADVNKTEPESGQKVTITGTVKPAAPGAQVRVQVRYAGQKTWKTLGQARLSRSGSYRFKDQVTSVRERRYRVVKPADARRAQGTARTAKVTVFGWRDLTSIGAVPGGTLYEGGGATIAGSHYPSSLRGGNQTASSAIEFNLNRDCKTLDATVGIDDASASGSSATLTLAADGTQRFQGTFGLAQAQHVVSDVTGVFRISLSATQTGGAYAAVGSPKVLCSF
ncbi:hypothetical protein G5V58_03115 [Nocardioides anomalus]|uniref:Glycosyl hydrolase family 98 putative carbohydrate-binding module domain-containing protein n=1 Tax=Nocardioides anomalus TaxID=2712223 RepID=A0A6G6W9L0_9ACTN|nr:NPCBM/NEW2 domain-containing protein [Nocardioides anomalus]QIG41906.1 hypothetical protein G5V58_03115 [Nocardioides anomalus]